MEGVASRVDWYGWLEVALQRCYMNEIVCRAITEPTTRERIQRNSNRGSLDSLDIGCNGLPVIILLPVIEALCVGDVRVPCARIELASYAQSGSYCCKAERLFQRVIPIRNCTQFAALGWYSSEPQTVTIPRLEGYVRAY